MIGLVWLGLALLIRAFRLKRRVRLRRRKLALRRRLAQTRSMNLQNEGRNQARSERTSTGQDTMREHNGGQTVKLGVDLSQGAASLIEEDIHGYRHHRLFRLLRPHPRHERSFWRRTGGHWPSRRLRHRLRAHRLLLARSDDPVPGAVLLRLHAGRRRVRHRRGRPGRLQQPALGPADPRGHPRTSWSASSPS